MNTVDALTLHGGHCANFLDTGGKATSETVKSSFRIISSDARVKAIFVNIFGGLTRCDMIAEGIIMAFRDLGMEVPVVVRLRGTNEEIGQKMVSLVRWFFWHITELSCFSRLRTVDFVSMHLTALRMRRRKLSVLQVAHRRIHYRRQEPFKCIESIA